LIPLAYTLLPLEAPWTEARRICRRVWLLRSKGLIAEAQRIEDTELAAVQVRAVPGGGLEADARFKALMTEERERMDAAVAFAEVLAPMLSERLRVFAPERGRTGMSPAPERKEPGPGGEARGIADYIDEMLAQDRAGSP
jgi:hypothetical protein